MPKTKQQKQQIIENLEEKIKKQKSVILLDYSKVNAQDFFKLRQELKQSDSQLLVAKKTLLGKVLEKFKQNELANKIKEIKQQLALAFGFNDEIAPAKICKGFQQKNENLKILGGILENKFLTAEEVGGLASLASKPELLGRIVGTLQSPISNFARVLQGNIKGLITIFSRLNEKK